MLRKFNLRYYWININTTGEN